MKVPVEGGRLAHRLGSEILSSVCTHEPAYLWAGFAP